MGAVSTAEGEFGADALNEVTEGYTPEGEAAVRYANRGWRILPIKPGTKEPSLKAWPTKASNCPGDAFEWYTGRYRGHCVGIATGRESGVWVVDVDVSHGKDGMASMALLEQEHGEFPEGAEVVTGSNGAHLYFTFEGVPEDAEIRNDAGRKLGADLDIRGDGGYVVAPPTRHSETGQRYAWDAGSPDEAADPPAWLVEKVTHVETATPTPSATTGDADGWREWHDRNPWADQLPKDGWTLHHTDRSGEMFWTRPGKEKRDGSSATTGFTGNDNMQVFSTSIPELPPGPYSMLDYMARVHFDGVQSAAGTWMRQALDKAPLGSERWHEETFSAELRSHGSSVREHLTEMANRPDGIAHLLSSEINFRTFWTVDHLTEDWLIEPFLPRGRQVMIFSKPGLGKSLLAFEAAVALATGRPVLDHPAGDPIHVLYIDAEMSSGDVYERLTDLGYGPDDDLSRLHYHQWPELASLDTDRGGIELAALVEHCGAHLVVIDTLGKTIEGEDNSADTYMRFGRYTGGRLKRMGVTTLLIDHSGHGDDSRPMGSVKKTADADVVWRLKRTDSDGLKLDATKRRIKWVPETVDLTRESEPLRHVTTVQGWAHGTKDVAALLDRLGVPLGAGRDRARKALKDAGETVGNPTLQSALRFRKALDAGDILVPET